MWKNLNNDLLKILLINQKSQFSYKVILLDSSDI